RTGRHMPRQSYMVAELPGIWNFYANGDIQPNGDYRHTNLQGAYSNSLLQSRIRSGVRRLVRIADFDEEHLILKEYPSIFGGSSSHESWITEQNK
ncbi:MAG: hypothetical protein ACFCU3_04485, partial [Verrucomicrobiales bacterium]